MWNTPTASASKVFAMVFVAMFWCAISHAHGGGISEASDRVTIKDSIGPDEELNPGINGTASEVGGWSGGGGGQAVLHGGRYVLKDLLSLSGLVDSIDTFEQKTTELTPKEYAMEVLQNWGVQGDNLKPAKAYTAFQFATWKMVNDFEIPDPLKDKLSGVSKSDDQTLQLAIYTIRFIDLMSFEYVIQIHRERYNNLDRMSQAGLYIHESLRHAQYAFDDDKFFTDDRLEYATTIFLACRPNQSLGNFLGHYLSRESATTIIERFGDPNIFVTSHCIRYY